MCDEFWLSQSEAFMTVTSYFVLIMLFFKLTISHPGSTEKDRRWPRGKTVKET